MMLWLETDRPGEQVLSPGAAGQALLTWTVMGGPLKIHLLTQPTLEKLLKQMQDLFYKNSKPQPPPSWSLGYHLCRDVGDPYYRQHQIIEKMLEEEDNGVKKPNVPFDSDCIDEQLFDFAFHQTLTSMSEHLFDIEAIVEFLTNHGKGFVLPMMIQTNRESCNPTLMACAVLSETNNSLVLGQLGNVVVKENSHCHIMSNLNVMCIVRKLHGKCREFSVYKLILSHLRKPKTRNMSPKFTQLATDGLELSYWSKV